MDGESDSQEGGQIWKERGREGGREGGRGTGKQGGGQIKTVNACACRGTHPDVDTRIDAWTDKGTPHCNPPSHEATEMQPSSS